MASPSIAELFRVQDRFLRSVHLERDFADPKALQGYVVTPQTKRYVERLATGLRTNSGQRAWRITGDYGSGKSSFALFLAHLFGEQHTRLPDHLRQTVNFKHLGVPRPRLLPVLITGSHEPIARSVLRAIRRDILATCERGRPPAIIERIDDQLKNAAQIIPDQIVVQLVTEACAYIVTTNKGSGIFLILDELGKFLEFGALRPEQQDIFLLQALAEAASRSNESPLFIVGILHQGFSAYAEHLSQHAQREWEKIAGRFDELVFNQPVEHTSLLIADALNTRLDHLPKRSITQMSEDMTTAIDLGWFGAAAAKSSLVTAASRLYPLHPSVVPVLIRLFSRFGQNERSLFSFLLSNEPSGLKDFARQATASDRFYRIHNLYDYARHSFGYQLGRESFRNHWNHIDSLIESFPKELECDLQLLKTIGLLNLLDTASLLASEQLILLAVSRDEKQVKSSLRRLKSKQILYYRGVGGGYCLWPHTSVNLEKIHEDAGRVLGRTPQRVGPRIETYLETRPIVARRHYIETGNLRHFDVRFCAVESLQVESQYDAEKADGKIVVALCETEEERSTALQFAQSTEVRHKDAVLLAIPRPLRTLAKLVNAVERWEWVLANTPELSNDTFAAEEVSRQLAASRDVLHQRLRSFIGVHHITGAGELTWFGRGKQLTFAHGRELLAHLSHICNEIYPSAPRVANELINRRTLSSAAAAARTRLIEGIFSSQSKPYLGMTPAKKPPEMSIYLSLLKNSGLHKQREDDWRLVKPAVNRDPCNVRPTLDCIQEILDSRGMQRVRVSEVLRSLRHPPFGIRDGLAPVLFAVYAAINEQHLAFYNNGNFLRELGGLDLIRLAKLPDTFEIQYCKMAGVRTELFERLLKILEVKRGSMREIDILDVVRPLSIFAAELPLFTQKTRSLSPVSSAVRAALLSAREPAGLLFRDLPAACGIPEFKTERRSDHKHVDGFIVSLKGAISELKMIYPSLQARMKASLIDALGLSSEQGFRTALSQRAQQLLLAVKEPRLKAFCNRLADNELAEPEWLESLGSLIVSVPPHRWTDADLERFIQELAAMCGRFLHVESITFRTNGEQYSDSPLRISLTQLDGAEADRILYFPESAADKISEIEERLAEVLSDSPAIGLAAAARVMWKLLSKEVAQ